jgi:hypothetical protein
MASPIIIPKKSTIAGKVPLPEQLSGGEVCVNWADQVWQGKHPTTNGVVPIGAPAIHSHDELYSLDQTKHLELQNNGDLTLPNGGTISDSAAAEGSLTFTPPSATNQWTLGIDGSTILPNNTLKGYSFTATNTVTNYIPQAGSFLYDDSPILGLITTEGGAWYIKGPGLVGWKQITQAQDNSGVALILRIGSGNTPLPDGSEFPSGGGNVYTISQYIEFNLKVADKTWIFNKDGDLTLPASGDILDSNGTSVLGGGTQANWNSASGPSQILNKPTLGTAAATDSTAYATAAQGATADSALQASALTPYRTSAAQDTIDAGKVSSNTTGIANTTPLTNMMQITLAGYNAITPAANTLYIIVG